MRSKSLKILVSSLVFACGCPSSSSTDGGTNNGGGDMAMGGGGQDGGGGGDAGGQDAAPGLSMRISWDLYGVGTMYQTMKPVNCDDPLAMITKFHFTVTNMAGMKAESDAPCPKGTNFGDVVIAVPDTTGPFAITTTPDGKGEQLVHSDFDVRYVDDGYIAHVTVPFDDH